MENQTQPSAQNEPSLLKHHGPMKIAEAVKHSGRSETWLRTHECAWCGQTLLRALQYGCGAIYENCDPLQKKFSDAERFKAVGDPAHAPAGSAST